MGGLKGADRLANLGEVSTGATEGSEARSEPREPSVSGAFDRSVLLSASLSLS